MAELIIFLAAFGITAIPVMIIGDKVRQIEALKNQLRNAKRDQWYD